MLGALEWILFVVVGVWWLASYRFGHRKRLDLNYYCVCLLLDDELRTAQKDNFQQWIRRQSDAADANTLALHAYVAVEKAATSTRATGLFHSRDLLWHCKRKS